MARDGSGRTWRPLGVWLAVSAASVAAAASVPGAWRGVHHGADFADLLVAGCASALAASLVWLWVVTTATVAGLLAGRRPRWHAGATRRLVLVACGAAVVAGPVLPAVAASGDGTELLAGLALPDRATAPVHRIAHRPTLLRPTPPSPPGSYLVRPGDSLWSIAQAHPAGGTSVDERWRAIWKLNHDVVGDDPDLILPGQALRLPAHPTTPTDGDR